MVMFKLAGVLLLFLSACSNERADGENTRDHEQRVVAETEADDYILRAVSEQRVYEEGDDVSVTMKLMYTGSKETAEIHHAESPFRILWSNVDSGVSWSGVVREVGKSSVLEQNKWYEETFDTADTLEEISQSAQGTEDDEFFLEMAESEAFPPGEYELEISTEFADTPSDEDNEKKRHTYNTSLVFTVES